MAAVDDRTGTIARPETRPFREVSYGYTYFEEGDVLFAKITPCMQNGKHAVARGLLGGMGFGTTEFHVIRPGSTITAGWVWNFLRQRSVLEDAERFLTGAVGQQRLPASYLTNITVPLPPVPEQIRLAALIQTQLAHVARARAAAEAQLAAARSLPAALLREVFESEEARGWPRVRIGDVSTVQSGYAFKSEWFSEDGIRLLRNANVFQGFIDWSDVVFLPEEQRSAFPPYELSEGDIVLSLDRPVVSGGLKLARLTSADVPSLLLQRVGRFRLRDNVCPDFLFAFLRSERFIRAITGHDQSLGVPHVSPKQVEAVEMPLPPMDIQIEIAGIIGERIDRAAELADRIQAQIDKIEQTPTAILQAAFEGGL